MHTSTIQILKLEIQHSKKLNPDTGKPYESTIARTALLDDDGQLQTVGRLRVPRDLVEHAKVGTFRASFALQVPDFGEFKGEVISVLTGLVPMPVQRATPVPSPAPSLAPKAV